MDFTCRRKGAAPAPAGVPALLNAGAAGTLYCTHCGVKLPADQGRRWVSPRRFADLPEMRHAGAAGLCLLHPLRD